MKNKELIIVVEGLLKRVAKLEEAIRFDSHDGMTNIGITMEAETTAKEERYEAALKAIATDPMSGEDCARIAKEVLKDER